MKRLKLMTVVGTRPELIRLSEVIKKADRHFEHVFAHTGQNYDDRLGEIFYADLGLRRPDLYFGVGGGHVGDTIGKVISRSYEAMLTERPDALLILGDTNSALCAVAAKRLKIPIFHMEAGNRCFDENLPEEVNRRIVDHVADVHLAYTEHARRYLIAEGVRGEHIYVTGSPMREVIAANRAAIDASPVLKDLGLEAGRYITLSAHREENVDHPGHFSGLAAAINAVAERHALPVIYSVHPRSARRIEEQGVAFHPLVRTMPPFCFSDFTRLMECARCVISDSGTMPEEAAINRFPAVCIRTSTERPEALDKGAFILAGITRESVLQAVDLALGLADAGAFGVPVPDYEDANVSAKVIRLIQSYTGVINDTVWRKERMGNEA